MRKKVYVILGTTIYLKIGNWAKSANFVHGASIYHHQRSSSSEAVSEHSTYSLLLIERAKGGNFWPRKQHFDSTVNY